MKREHHKMAECPTNTTFDGYIGLLCSTIDVNYHFPYASSVFLSQGSVTVLPTDLMVRRDPNGDYTLLFSSSKFSVSAGQSAKVVLNGQVSGASSMNPWVHGCVITGDAFVTAKQEILDSSGNVLYSTSVTLHAGDIQAQAGAHFTETSPYNIMRITIEVNGGTNGSASMTSLGTHFNP